MSAALDPRHAPLRLGVVSYLNMQPLVYGLADEAPADELEVRPAPPSRLAQWLVGGEIDLGMIPVASIFQHPEWRVLSGSMIGARGAVASVLALGGGDPADWRTLRPDSQSMTSNALARVVLDGVYRVAPRAGVPLPPDGWEPPRHPVEGEAFVAIGTRALRWREAWLASGGVALDLGEIWTRWTGLPMVFALWAVREGAALGDWPARLEALKARNLARLPQICRDWPAHREDGLTPEQAESYLRSNVDFNFDAAARAGLERFYDAGCLLQLFKPGWQFTEWT